MRDFVPKRHSRWFSLIGENYHEKIEIAQISVNRYSHSNEILECIGGQPDRFEIVGTVLPEKEKDRLPQKTEKLRRYPELALEEVLQNPEIEAVTVETDEIYLAKYALMAARAGKHIHMEKPCGVELSDFEELIRTVKQTGKVFHTGYMYRYNPVVKELIKVVKDGELGEIISVEAQMNCFNPKETRQWLQDFPGGMMFYLGCHLVDLVFTNQGRSQKNCPL